jgi:F-type H+-transporting ATPase subunit b
MSIRHFLSVATRFGIAFCVIAAPVLAQESSQPKIEDSPTGQVFRWINFAIVFGLIVWGFSKAVPYFRKNAEDISQKIAEGARAREAAEQRRAEAQAKLATIDTEVAKLREESKKATALEAERIKAMAKSEAEMIERAAQAEIAASEHEAKQQLRIMAATMAVERAEALLRKELQPKVESERFFQFVAAMAILVGKQQQAKN